MRVDQHARVKYVIDGDTLRAQSGKKIRLIGINTPEISHEPGVPSQPYAQKARDFLQSLTPPDSHIGLVYDRQRKDHYQRTLAYITLPDGTDIQQKILRKGLATSIAVPPNTRNLACYRAIEQQARQQQKGIWSLPQYQIINTGQLRKQDIKNYRFIRGSVKKHLVFTHYSLIFFHQGRFSIKLNGDAHQYWKTRALRDKTIVVRGFVYRFKRGYGMTIKARQNIQTQ